MRLVLIGYRGSGKTTVGRILSERLSVTFVDTDKEVERLVGCSVENFVERHGWQAFREVELEVLSMVSRMEKVVVASGGGSFMNPSAMELFRVGGWIFVYLRASPEVLRKRLLRSGGRPSLTGRDPLDEVEVVLQRREPVYLSMSHLVVDTDGKTPSEVAQEIVDFLSNLS